MMYQYDDGSAIGVDPSGNVFSREIGSTTWVDDANPAPAGWTVFSVDAQEQARMGQGYPQNGQSWDQNAAILGISRLLDTAGRTYAAVKGSQPATFAGQNGQTYVQTPKPAGQQGGGLVPLLLIGGLALALAG